MRKNKEAYQGIMDLVLLVSFPRAAWECSIYAPR